MTSQGIDSDPIQNKLIKWSFRPEDKKVCMIPTAAEGWKENSRAAVKATKELKNLGFFQIDFIDVEFEDPLLMKHYDLIFIPGGNPFYLLFHLKRSKADIIIKELAEEKAIVTSSAGTLVLGKDIELIKYFDEKINTIGMTDLKGLDLMDFTIYPHYTQRKR